MRGGALPVWFNSLFGTALRPALALATSLAAYGAVTVPVAAAPAIVVDAQTGDVLYAEDATENWYPASLTKLMTFYVALAAVRDKKISLDTPILVSRRAAAQAPSKMGFKPGTELTLGNALKMMMVKSANDLAVAIAEAVSGSVDAFAEDMNTTAAQLGMRQSHFANPNGLPDPEHVSSARDLAILSRAIYQSFPQEAQILSIGALRLGDEIVPGHNSLLGRYPGADGMKTGFTCAAGFNLITSSERNGHHYIAVVLGAPDVKVRMMKSAILLDRAFDGVDHPIEKLDSLDPGASLSAAPDMHNQVCRGRARTIAAWQAENSRLEAPLLTASASGTPAAAPSPPGIGLFAPITSAPMAPMAPVAPTIAMMPKPVFDPVPVFLGAAPGYQGPVAQARPPHSAVGTPPLPGAEPVVAEKPAANTEATDSEEEQPKVAVAHHRGHKAVKVAAHGKAHRRHVAKAETKEAAGDGDSTPKHHASKKAHSKAAAKVAKAIPAKKHVAAKHVAAKHVAAKPAQ